MMIAADFMILGATEDSLRLAKRIARTGRGCLVLETRQREELESTLLEQNVPIVFGLRFTSLSVGTETSNTFLSDQMGRGYLTPTLLRDATYTGHPSQANTQCLEVALDNIQWALDTLLARRTLCDDVAEESLQLKMRQCAAAHPDNYQVTSAVIDQCLFNRVA
jgi:hypothetical protein